MIEDLLINKILKEKSLKVLKENGLQADHFLTASNKIQFINDHFQQYGVVPDHTTFLAVYRDFQVVDVTESNDYLAYKLKEAYLYKESVPVLKKVEELIREDSFKAVQFLKEQVDALIKQNSLRVGRGYDIMANAQDRFTEFKTRVDADGLLGITTGIALMDEILHGWLKEDLVVIFARTNVGKSWILLYFLTMAWAAGFKVLMYSGEMGKHIVGFRVDTLYQHFSNRGLMNGNTDLGGNANIGDRSMEDYQQYVTELSGKEGFIVVTPKDFGGNKPTVDELKNLYMYYDADLLGVDQITLMRDQRKGENKRIQYTNISEDLYLMSEELQKPVLAVTQANRDSVKNKAEPDAPELHEIGESDGIAQNATRVISMSMVDNVLKLAIKKNRYGLNNKDVLMMWDINYGIMKPLLEGGQQEQSAYGF